MFGENESLPPVIPPPPPRTRAARTVVLVLVGCVILEIPAYLLWKRTERAEREASALAVQAQEARREALLARAQAAAAASQASLAKDSAAHSAEERDQAVQARAQSEQAATQAQHQAALATEQATQAQQQASQAQQEAVTLRAQRQAELDHLHTVLSQIASTRQTASGLVVTLDSNAIRFDFDKSTIRPGNREVLSRMAGVLMTLEGYQIYVYGYTDDIGAAQHNQKLSERRAAAVRDYLVQSGVDPKIIGTKGYGESDPLDSGQSMQARAKNRRVEIGIVDSTLLMLGVASPAGPGNSR
jgi:outer membrane protein OmpA-like peptidoglycan-associated protein